jgi:hypothetical protein
LQLTDSQAVHLQLTESHMVHLQLLDIYSVVFESVNYSCIKYFTVIMVLEDAKSTLAVFRQHTWFGSISQAIH